MGDRRPAVLVVSIALFVVASCFVALLFVSRIFVVRRVGRQDYLMLLAWVFLLPPTPPFSAGCRLRSRMQF